MFFSLDAGLGLKIFILVQNALLGGIKHPILICDTLLGQNLPILVQNAQFWPLKAHFQSSCSFGAKPHGFGSKPPNLGAEKWLLRTADLGLKPFISVQNQNPSFGASSAPVLPATPFRGETSRIWVKPPLLAPNRPFFWRRRFGAKSSSFGGAAPPPAGPRGAPPG